MSNHTRLYHTIIAACLLGAALGCAGHARAQTSRGNGIAFAGFRGMSTSVVSFHRWLDHPGNKKPAPHFYTATSNTAATPDAHHPSRPFVGAIGLQLGAWRIEGQSYSLTTGFAGKTHSGGGQAQTRLGLASLTYDFKPFAQAPVTSYISAGAGVAMHEMWHGGINTKFDADDRAITPVWQLGGGLNYRLTDQLWFNGDYRFTGSPSLLDQGYDLNLNDHRMRVGVTYQMPTTHKPDHAPRAQDRAPPPSFAP